VFSLELFSFPLIRLCCNGQLGGLKSFGTIDFPLFHSVIFYTLYSAINTSTKQRTQKRVLLLGVMFTTCIETQCSVPHGLYIVPRGDPQEEICSNVPFFHLHRRPHKLLHQVLSLIRRDKTVVSAGKRYGNNLEKYFFLIGEVRVNELTILFSYFKIRIWL